MSFDQATQIFKKGSTTYFTASLFFPKKIKKDVFTLYAFVRTADDFVDQTPQNVAGFYQFSSTYRDALAGKVVPEVIISNFVKLQKKYSIPQRWVDAFLKAMEADLYKSHYQNISELLLYMYGSAEVIGLMMAKIMSVSPKGYQSARLLGRSMQYANFLRDIAEDIELGRQYIPQEISAQYGLEKLDLAKIQDKPDSFKRLYISESARYSRWNEGAKKGFCFLSQEVMIPIAAASEMYSWTLKKICDNPLVVLHKKIKPSKWRVMASVIRQQLKYI